MAIDLESYQRIKKEAGDAGALLVAVSKTKPASDILALYQEGQRDFGENYVQELCDKAAQLPADIHWHFIGHLQRNKVKYIAPFVYLIHGVDSFRLLEEIGKQADKLNRELHCLLQVHIASEETKFGLSESELTDCFQQISAARNNNKLIRVRIRGLMGMASFTENQGIVANEFLVLRSMFDRFQEHFDQEAGKTILSMGMSADYRLALEKGSNLIRIGSSLFGARDYATQ